MGTYSGMNHRPSLIIAAFLVGPLFVGNGLRAENEDAPVPNIAAPKVGQTLSFKTDNGREMKHSILRRIEPDGLTFETKTGLEKISISSLPPDLALHFKFDPEEIARHVEKQRALQKALAAKQAAEAAEAARRAEIERKPATPPPRPAARAEPPLGARAEKALGSPRLGGRGAEK